ncbi:hypothetical protein M513_13291 [Trichuris suis]|uniref:HTH CENPB-type domain-containing protein n=1 Tax=Trichuris suis TaxID=68888 RepID=A0A085LLI0_9BILA|nr:hypothetical protein M513_13291 [Trichuris suis]
MKKKVPRRKCALRGRAPSWPELENHVAEWVKEQRRNGHMVTRNAIRSKAMEWANKNAHVFFSFNATAGWCSCFMKRKDLVLREKTNVAQRMPADLEAKTGGWMKVA